MTLSYSQQYYIDNKERLSQQAKERYEKNKEKRKRQAKEYYEANKEKAYENNKNWKRNNPEIHKKSQRDWEARHPEYYIINNARRRAKMFNVPFELKRTDIVVPDICPVLGIPIFRGKDGKSSDNSPSLDRIIPQKGYTKDNVRIISAKANRWKNEMTLDDALKIVAYLKGEV